MISLSGTQALLASTSAASVVTYTVTGLETSTAVPPVAQSYQVLAQGVVQTSATNIYSPSAASVSALVSSIFMSNISASVATVQVAIDGSGLGHRIATLAIPISGFAEYEDGNGWTITSPAVGTALTEITSDDGTITVTNPQGPIVDLSGTSKGFVIAMATAL